MIMIDATYPGLVISGTYEPSLHNSYYQTCRIDAASYSGRQRDGGGQGGRGCLLSLIY